ncbi:MAG: hypothetical protein ABEH89_01045 [bacterium]
MIGEPGEETQETPSSDQSDRPKGQWSNTQVGDLAEENDTTGAGTGDENQGESDDVEQMFEKQSTLIESLR